MLTRDPHLCWLTVYRSAHMDMRAWCRPTAKHVACNLLQEYALHTVFYKSKEPFCWYLLLTIYSLYLSIYIYIYKLVQDLGVYKLKTGPSYKLNTGPSFSLFSPFWKCLLEMFRNTNSATVCQNCVFAKLSGSQKWGFRKENCIYCFCLFYVGEIETEKRETNKMEKAKNNYKK